MEVYDLSEENELDTCIKIEVPVPEGDEARSLSQEELGQGPEDQLLKKLLSSLAFG